MHLLTGVCYRTVRAFNSSRTTEAVALDVSKNLTGFGTLIFFDKLKFYGVPSRMFGFILYFVSNILLMLQVVMNVNFFKNV